MIKNAKTGNLMSKNRTIAKDVTFRMKESVKLRKQKKVGTVTHGVNGSMCRMSLSRQETVQKNRKVEADGRADLWF